MATQSSVLLQFQRVDARAEFDRSRRELKNSLLDHGAQSAAARLMELGISLDTGVTRMKRDLLGSSLCWNEENQQIAKWISQQHRGLAEMATRVVEEIRGGEDDEMFRQMVALTFFQSGEALKWSIARIRVDYAPLHRMLEEMISAARHRETFSWVAEGRGHTTTIEALYFRALLLDRFTSGSLTPPQVAILDAWVWEWMGALHGESTCAGGDVLRVDLDSSAGLREGKRKGEGASLYLPLATLEAERRKIVTNLHRGRLTPAHGWVSELRVEEHINVLDHLRHAFVAAESDTPLRARRMPAGGTRVEIWLGLQEILSRGIGVGTETGRYRALNLADPAIALESSASRYSESTRRYLWLVDASASGLGFEGLECDAAGIEVGDLLGWRNITGGPVILARVMRRMPSATSGQVFLGVQLLTEAAQPLKLSQVVSFDNGNANGTYLFVPGADESGQHDAFLVSDKTYELQASYSTHVGNDAFTLKFNRVRFKGRGWILAGFEILPEPKRAPASPATEEREFNFTLELVGADEKEEDLDPWGGEVRGRLLS
jgi:hypothetical protein